ncbi:uncharacterized protein LOC107458006 [Arachis duranensis]|uniref:Glutathione S-transferase 3, mitochondrial n=1 Tax=Arachis duranensis TaxID=130453 RepID=A0A9C6TEW2_ARADU|nr:microsomal glutathione S-transferase 3-like [Arachis hypogaea]XP_052107473.1 uncharacterized protein LOC107458006 [Arachis duranensis]
MATIIELVPKEYGFVAIVLVIYCLLNLYMAAQVAIVRKRYKVPYPTLYASESQNKYAKLFNCIQRGHQNSLETMAVFFMLMILGGLKHPSICGVLGVLYIIAGYFYFKGYATGDPNNRHKSRPLRGFIASGEVSSAVCTVDDVPPQFVFCRSRCAAAAAATAAVPPFLCFVPLPPSLTLPNVGFGKEAHKQPFNNVLYNCMRIA